ncbi:MAG: PIN domain-containing protein [Proteobacteria bacterium]|nr:PIN domain-containing protein [Pseudomonadota bacterium]
MLEDVKPYSDRVHEFVISHFRDNTIFTTSTITNTEYLVIPYRIHDYQKVIEFERLKKTLKMRVIAADDAITKSAAQIRAKYSGIKSMDALQLASAIVSGCDVFLTNDKQLRQVEEIQVLLVDNL